MSNAIEILKPANVGKSVAMLQANLADAFRLEIPVLGFGDTGTVEAFEKGTSKPRDFGSRRLNRFRTADGKRFQLHATRGWKCIGRAA